MPVWEITREMFLSESEVAQLLRQLADQVEHSDSDDDSARTDRLIVWTLLYSGLRNSELCGLKLADTIVGTKRSVFLVRGTPRQDRTVHVPAELSEEIERFSRRVHGPKSRKQALSKPLFLNERGKPYDRTALYRRVVRILTAAGLGARASVQLLRHTYGYLAYKGTGGNLLYLQRQMGHAHPMVSSVYAQFVEEDYDEMSNRLWLSVNSKPLRKRRKESV